jgi:hypothetical protein
MVTPDAARHDEAMPAGYPSAWEFDGLLRNGEAAVVRPIRPADAPALVGLHSAVSPGTLHHHVLLARPTLSLEAAARFSDVDYGSRAVGLGAGAEGLWLWPRLVVWLVHSPAWQLLRLATVRG